MRKEIVFHDFTPASFHLAVVTGWSGATELILINSTGLGHDMLGRLDGLEGEEIVVSRRVFLDDIVRFSVVIIACSDLACLVHSKAR